MNTDLSSLYQLLQQGQLDRAEKMALEIAASDTANPELPRVLAFINLQRGQLDAGVEQLNRSLQLQPNYLPSLVDMGNVMMAANRAAESLAYFDQVIALDNSIIDAWFQRGNALRQLARYDEALDSFLQVLQRAGDNAPAMNNAADMLHSLNRDEEALDYYNRALSVEPRLIEAYNGRGVTHLAMGNSTAALNDYQSALRLDPQHTFAHFNKSTAHLIDGDLLEGWAEYEWRPSKAQTIAIRGYTQPEWRGEDLQGKTILLHPEQGFGDTLQFCRYAKNVAQRGAKVVGFVQPPLKPLLESFDGFDAIVTRGETPPEFDYQCSYLSLPGIFQTTLESIPDRDAYITAPAKKISQWQETLGERKRPRIGLVWSGNRAHSNDHNRSLNLAQLLPCFESLDVDIVSLQIECDNEDAKAAANDSRVSHFGEQLHDFTDTAALASLMDVVVTVDTSTAHLSAAMGLPTWILLPAFPDWRWLWKRSDSPWYNSARLFRQQQAGLWDNVIEELRAALQHRL